MANVFSLALFMAMVAIFMYVTFLSHDSELPEIKEIWFGKEKLIAGESLPKDPVTINKFTVNVSNEVLQDLQRRLESARFVEPIVGTQFNYGFNSDYLKKVVNYWRTKFDWRKQEVILNQMNHYKTQINGINIHYIHVKPSKSAKSIIHGWPDSVWHYYKMIALLIEPTNDMAFEIICPSIPGFGFSEAPKQEGFNILQTARIFVKLMDRLQYKEFVIHGSHLGSIIAKTVSLFYPKRVRGMHIIGGMSFKFIGMAPIKSIVGVFLPSLVFTNAETDYNKLYPFWDKFYFYLKEFAYLYQTTTKSDTMGASLIDSPVGLAAYILEKYSTWTDPNCMNKFDGGLTQKFTLDELLTNVMIYWISNNIVSTLRYDYSIVPFIHNHVVSAGVPVAIADFPYEISRSPKDIIEDQYSNLVQYTEMPRGGHLAAFEEPELLSNDIKKFIKTVLENESQINSQ